MTGSRFKNFTSRAQIARRIGVHRAKIGRELRRGAWQPEHDHANLRPYLRNRLDTCSPHERLYLGGQAQPQPETRTARSHQPYRMRQDWLVNWVLSVFRRGWTPEEISRRLPVEFPDDARMRVGVETLYAWIYAPQRRDRQLWQYLPRGHKKRRRRSGRKVHSERIKWRTSIHDWPAEVWDRVQFGHWESDSVLGVRGTNEHFNGRIHKNLPKGTSFENLTQAELNEFITDINNRPRKILGWATPAEVFQELCSQWATATCCTSNQNPGPRTTSLTGVCFLSWWSCRHLLFGSPGSSSRPRFSNGYLCFLTCDSFLNSFGQTNKWSTN
jgi:IS30 family transposase